jgi:hypothetical protein
MKLRRTPLGIPCVAAIIHVLRDKVNLSPFNKIHERMVSGSMREMEERPRCCKKAIKHVSTIMQTLCQATGYPDLQGNSSSRMMRESDSAK